VRLPESIHPLASIVHTKIESAAAAVAYAANGAVFTWGAISFNQIMMLIGIVFAAATYFTSLYFQRRREIREQELHEHLFLVDLKKQMADSLDKKRDI